jgi:hypothetical protein
MSGQLPDDRPQAQAVLVIAERDGIRIVFEQVVNAARMVVGVPAAQAQDGAHFAPILQRVRSVFIGMDGDAVGLAVLLDG